VCVIAMHVLQVMARGEDIDCMCQILAGNFQEDKEEEPEAKEVGRVPATAAASNSELCGNVPLAVLMALLALCVKWLLTKLVWVDLYSSMSLFIFIIIFFKSLVRLHTCLHHIYTCTHTQTQANAHTCHTYSQTRVRTYVLMFCVGLFSQAGV